MTRLTFIIGGARSGKSRYAEKLATQTSQRVLFVATAQALDEEMHRRILAHQSRRPAAWQTRELPEDPGGHLLEDVPHADIILIDCLTLLISNAVLKAAGDVEQPDEAAATVLVEAEVEGLLKAARSIEAHWLVISNEVGGGLVPPYPVGRLYRDLLGWANQRLAQEASEVIWMVAGIPVPIGQYR